nr:myb-related protein B-like [Tanacetum cinerariifolium]
MFASLAKSSNAEIIKGPWTKEEDDHITKLVEANGCMKWSVIAKDLPGWIGKQCRERWHNHLDPAVKREAWSKEEHCLHLNYTHCPNKDCHLLPWRTIS